MLPHLWIQKRVMVHLGEATAAVMFDVAGGALRHPRMKLRRLLPTKILAGMTAQACLRLYALERRVAGRALPSKALVGRR